MWVDVRSCHNVVYAHIRGGGKEGSRVVGVVGVGRRMVRV